MEPFGPTCQELDAAAVARLTRLGGPELARRIIGLFLESAPRRVAAAADGCRTGDAAAVELSAHSLRSSAANVGATAIVALAAEVERLAAVGELPPLGLLLDELAAAYSRVRPGLEAALSGDPP